MPAFPPRPAAADEDHKLLKSPANERETKSSGTVAFHCDGTAMPGRYHPDPPSLSHGRTMGRWTHVSLSHYGDSDSKKYHHSGKKSTHCIRKYRKKAKKRKPTRKNIGFRCKTRFGERSYFVLTGWTSFTTSRTGYSESESGTLYMVPVRIAGASDNAMSAGWATAMASPSFLP